MTWVGCLGSAQLGGTVRLLCLPSVSLIVVIGGCCDGSVEVLVVCTVTGYVRFGVILLCMGSTAMGYGKGYCECPVKWCWGVLEGVVRVSCGMLLECPGRCVIRGAL